MKWLLTFVLIFACLPFLSTPPSYAVSQSIVISEFRTRGTNGGNDEFIELANVSSSPVNLSGWNISASNASGDVTVRANLNNVTLNPGCFYLLTNSNTNGYSGSVSGNQTYGVGITDDGGIAVINNSGSVIDSVGMSAGSTFGEGNRLSPLTVSVNRSYERLKNTDGSFKDTDNNNADFVLRGASDPQNASSECLTISNPPPPSQCGVERWSIKTGTDTDAKLIDLQNITPTTTTTMRSWTAPNNIPSNTRVDPYEKTVYILNATLTKYKLEEDSDYHLVIEDAQGKSMIAEIPCSCCVGNQSPFLQAITQSRQKFDARFQATTSFQDTKTNIRITGVGFFDELHGQTGVAPNGIEIHPVLDIQFEPDLIKPVIVRAEIGGKKLYVYGLNFTSDAKIYINGEKQKTAIDEESDSTILVAKKGGKAIERGSTVTLQVRLSDGTLSQEFSFTR